MHLTLYPFIDPPPLTTHVLYAPWNRRRSIVRLDDRDDDQVSEPSGPPWWQSNSATATSFGKTTGSFVKSLSAGDPGDARQHTGGHATVTPVGLDHTSGVPNPGDLGKNTWSSISKGWAHFLVKHLRIKL